MDKQIAAIKSQLNEWLKSLESSGHCGEHDDDDCPDCKRFWAILKAWSTMDDLELLVQRQVVELANM